MADFTMPSLGADMDSGSVLEWCVAPGDRIRRGDVMAVIHTDKNDIDAEAFEEGVVGEILVEPGLEVPVGTPLATIVSVGAPAVSTPVSASATAETSAETPTLLVGTSSTPPSSAPTPRHPEPPTFSPLVRRMVDDEHLDPSTIHGTGPGGLLTRSDVESAAEAARARTGAGAGAGAGARTGAGAGGAAESTPGGEPRPDGPPRRVSPRARRLAAESGIDPAAVAARTGAVVTGDDVLGHLAGSAVAARPVAAADVRGAGVALTTTGPPPASGSAVGEVVDDRKDAMRRRIATLMERSKREIPHYHLVRRIDLTTALDWLSAHNETRPVRERMIPSALLLTAVARAAAQVPGFNGHWRDGAYQPADRVDLGLIVSLRDGGLLVPVLADAAELSAPELMERLHGAVTRARTGRLRSSELGEGTLTVSALGDGGADAVFGVIHPPQVALVGFGRAHEAPWAEHGLLGVRTVVDATLAADHRVSEGHAGSRFLLALDTLLQDPAALEGAPSHD